MQGGEETVLREFVIWSVGLVFIHGEKHGTGVLIHMGEGLWPPRAARAEPILPFTRTRSLSQWPHSAHSAPTYKS